MTYVGAVRAALAGDGDPERAAQQRAYMKSELPYARTDQAWVQTFVGTHADRLSGLSRREALKHQTGTSSTAPTA